MVIILCHALSRQVITYAYTKQISFPLVGLALLLVDANPFPTWKGILWTGKQLVVLFAKTWREAGPRRNLATLVTIDNKSLWGL